MSVFEAGGLVLAIFLAVVCILVVDSLAVAHKLDAPVQG